MTDRSPQLDRKLRERRYREASAAVRSRLSLAGVAEERFEVLSLEAADAVWPVYVERLRATADDTLSWSAGESDTVQGILDATGRRLNGARVTWLARQESEVVAVEVQAGTILPLALDAFVSSSADLMLTTDGASDGLCLALNHVPLGDEFELTMWGSFRAT